MAVFAESLFPDSTGVIGKTEKNRRIALEDENLMVAQVSERAQLLKSQPDRLSGAERRVLRQGESALTTLLEDNQYLLRRLVRTYQPQATRGIDSDLEQEAIAAFIESIERFDPTKGARLGSYAYFRIRARLQDLRNKRNEEAIAVGKSFYESHETAAPEPIDVYEIDLVRVAISKLPERQQQVILLFLQNLSHDAIAQQLSLGVKAAQAYFYRAKKRLRSLLSGVLPDWLKISPVEAVVRVTVASSSLQSESASATESEDDKAPEPSAKRWPKVRLPKILKKAHVFFRKFPTTSIEVKKALFFLGKSVSESLLPFLLHPTQTTQGENQMTATKTPRQALRQVQNPQNLLPSGTNQQPILLTQIGRYLPPLWINLGLLSVATYFAHDPVFDSVAIALWLSVFYLYGIGRLTQFMTLRLNQRKWFTSLGTVGIALISAPEFLLAATDGEGSCANAGFLNKLATFSSSVLTSNTGGAVTNLNSFICQFIGMLALIAIIMMVGGFIYAGFEVTVRQQALATVAQPVVGIVITVIFCVVTIYIMSNPT